MAMADGDSCLLPKAASQAQAQAQAAGTISHSLVEKQRRDRINSLIDEASRARSVNTRRLHLPACAGVPPPSRRMREAVQPCECMHAFMSTPLQATSR